MQPLVSIVIPTYNRGSQLLTCLDSIIGQTYSNIEIIVVDDGSTDSTVEKINTYIQTKSLKNKLVYFKQANQGAPAARNYGLSMAKGNLIVFFDSDDLMLPQRISKQVMAMTDEDSDSCACGFTYTLNGEEHMPKIDNNQGFIGSLIHWNLIGSTTCWMYKKDLLNKIGGYDLSYACYQDWDVTFRYLTQCNKVSVVKEILNIVDNNERVDRITTLVHMENRIPHIQRYYLKVLKWLVDGERKRFLKDVIFSYVHQITFPYYKTVGLKAALKSYLSFIQAHKKASVKTSLSCNIFFFKCVIKTTLKIALNG